MTYARIVNNAIDTIGRLPNAARRLDNQNWVLGLDTAPPELVQTTGWFEVVDTPRPADTATTTHDRSVELVDGTPTVVWTERDKTPDELAAVEQEQKRSTLDDAITNAIAELLALANAPALPVPPSGTMTTATLSNVVRALRDECQATRAGAQRVAQTLADKIRLDRGDFDHLA